MFKECHRNYEMDRIFFHQHIIDKDIRNHKPININININMIILMLYVVCCMYKSLHT